MDKTENIIEIAKALVKAQAAITHAVKDSVNPFHKNKYADMAAVIEAVKKPLNDNGISFLQAVNMTETSPMVETILLHESGQYLMTKTPIYCQKPNDPQALGTGITYSKRYALQALLGLPSEDDDGNSASQVGKSQTTPAAAPAPNEKQKEFVDKVYEKLLDSTPEGMVVNRDKLAKELYSLKSLWPDDIKKAVTTADWLIKNNKMDAVCDKKGAQNEL